MGVLRSQVKSGVESDQDYDYFLVVLQLELEANDSAFELVNSLGPIQLDHAC